MSARPEIDPGNEAQRRAWDGDEGWYWAEHADRFDRSIAEYQPVFLHVADVRPGTVVLDVGCGNGRTTLDAAKLAGGGSALGVDLSSAMLAVARRRATTEGVDNATFVQADAQVHAFGDDAFDLVLGRTSAMFFADHGAAFANLRRCLRPGGRMAFLTWRPLAENEWLQEIAGALAGRRPPMLPPAGAGPFSLSEPDRIRALLQGFDEVSLEPVDAPMWFGTDADDAVRFLLGLQGWMLEGLDDDDRASAIEQLRATCAAHTGAGGVTFRSATWLIHARLRPTRQTARR